MSESPYPRKYRVPSDPRVGDGNYNGVSLHGCNTIVLNQAPMSVAVRALTLTEDADYRRTKRRTEWRAKFEQGHALMQHLAVLASQAKRASITLRSAMSAATSGRVVVTEGVDSESLAANLQLLAYAHRLDVTDVDAERIATRLGLVSSLIDAIGSEASDDLCVECEDGALARVFSCGVCLEPCWLGDNSSFASTCCNHRFCNRCWAGWVRASLDMGTASLRAFRCPNPGCAEPALTGNANSRDIKALGEGLKSLCAGLLDREDKRAIRDLLELDSNPDARRCPSCKHVTATRVSGPSAESLRCQNESCALVFCRFHGDAHPGEACSAFLRRLPVDKAHAAFARTNHTRRCPECGRSIWKNGGCDHSAQSLPLHARAVIVRLRARASSSAVEAPALLSRLRPVCALLSVSALDSPVTCVCACTCSID